MQNQIAPKSGGTSPGETREAIEQWHIALSAIINHIWNNWDDPEELMYVKLYPEYYLAAFGFDPQIPSYKTKIKFVFDTDDQVTYLHNKEVLTSHQSKDLGSANNTNSSTIPKTPSNSETTTDDHTIKDFKFVEPLNPEEVTYSSSLATKIVTIKEIRKSLKLHTLKYFGRRSSNEDFITFWSSIEGGKLADEGGFEDFTMKELSDLAETFDVKSVGDLINAGKSMIIGYRLAKLEDKKNRDNFEKINELLEENEWTDDNMKKIQDLTIKVIIALVFSFPKGIEKKIRASLNELLLIFKNVQKISDQGASKVKGRSASKVNDKDGPKATDKNDLKVSDKYWAKVLEYLEDLYRDQKLIILEQFSRSLKERGETIRLKLKWPEGLEIDEDDPYGDGVAINVQVILRKIQALNEEDEQVLFTLTGYFNPQGGDMSLVTQMEDNLEVTLKPEVEKLPSEDSKIKDQLKFTGTIKNFLSGVTYGELDLKCPFYKYAQLFNLRERTNGWKYEDLSSLAGVMVVVIPPKPADDEDMPGALDDYMAICRNQPFTCS